MRVTVLKPHICSPLVHYGSKPFHRVSYQKDHYRASVQPNHAITPSKYYLPPHGPPSNFSSEAFQIEERKRWKNDISYRQAQCVRAASIEEFYGPKDAFFSYFPALYYRINALAEEQHVIHGCTLSLSDTGQFQAFAVSFGPHSCIERYLRRWIGLDGTYSPAAVEYFDDTSRNCWARSAFPLPRSGFDIFNHVEALNAVFVPFRLLSPLRLVEALWTYVMEQRSERRLKVQNHALVSSVQAYFEGRLKEASAFRVI